VFTSNVDGQFQKARFDPERIVEAHGSIHHLQCSNNCRARGSGRRTTSIPEVDEARCELVSDLPCCPHCRALARPNILMFSDWHWKQTRTGQQKVRINTWRQQVKRPLVIELGAGEAIPTVRCMGKKPAIA